MPSSITAGSIPGVELLSKPYPIEELARKIRAVLDAGKAATGPAVAAAKRGPRRVLVVEDDALVRVAAVESLADLGLAAEEAETGRQALGVLAAHGDIDLLITDVGLPDIDGHDLAAEARKLRPSLKIILASGYSGPGRHPRRNGELPADILHLTKPYEAADLRRAIESLEV